MTATEELRRLLDERGVEWTAPNSILRDMMTCWTAGGFYYEAFEVPEPDGTFQLTATHQDDLTPEQVIAATLGATDARPTQVESSGTCHPKPHEQWTTVLLPEIAWNWDDRWPDYLSVAHDDHGEWRVYVPEATLGTWTCHNVAPTYLDFLCSECGFVHYYSDENDTGDGNEWHFCPNCGRKVVD